MWPDVATIPGISDHQREQLAVATKRPLGILTGGPGTGKTRTAAGIVAAIVQQYGAGSVACCAPTGKAAVVATAAMARMGLSIQSTTSHRLLGVQRNGHDGKGWGFIHGPGMPLPFRFLVIDEPSMLGTPLGSSIFSAIAPGTHILLVGDPYQLPPVEHGAPLRDMISAGIPTGKLTEIWRNDGGIVRACRLMKEGRGYQPSERIDVANGHNLRHYECRSAEQSLDVVRSLYRKAPPGVDRFADIQVLCTVREKSPLSVDCVNRMMQEFLLPDAERIDGIRFRVGDKVICTTNAMLALLDDEGNEIPDPFYTGSGKPEPKRDFVANGEIGRVIRLREKEMHVAIDAPKRTVKVGVIRSKSRKQEDEEQASKLSDFDLAYGITIHKSQGSSWKCPIVLIDDYNGANFVACRELYYTGVSRTELLGFTIGRMDTINRHLQRVSLASRKTFLEEQLKGVAA